MSRWTGKMAIRISPAFHHCKPDVVFITGINKKGVLIGKILNSNFLLITSNRSLVEYSPRLYERLYAQYKYREAKATMLFQGKKAKTGKDG